MAFLSLLRVVLIIVHVQLTCGQHCENGVKIPHFELPKSVMHPQFGQCFNVSEVKSMIPKSCCAGYYDEGDNCHPVCKNGCLNGVCTSPDNCKCNEGYVMTNGRCVPTCDPPCENGTCVGVNECRCLIGYNSVSENYRCEPVCDQKFTLVEHGVCIAPNVIRCNKAFILKLSVDYKLTCVNESQFHTSSFVFKAALKKFCIVVSIITGAIVILLVLVKIVKFLFKNKFQINIYGHSTPVTYNDGEYEAPSQLPFTTTVISSSSLPYTRESVNSKDTNINIMS